MPRRLLFQLLVIGLLLGGHYIVSGRAETRQNVIPLSYGETVSGEITDAKPADYYTFMGTLGDVIVIEMLSVDRSLDNLLAEPVLILRSPQGDNLVNTVRVFPVDDTVLAAELPTSGTYGIVATRDENVSTRSVGEYTLELILVPELRFDQVMFGTISSDDGAHYYFVRSASAFRIEYTRHEGDFSPQVTIHRLILERDGRRPVATAYGEDLTDAVIGVFKPGVTYLVEVHRHAFDYDFDIVDAHYTLRLTN